MVSTPILIGICIAAITGFGLYKSTSLKETADNIHVSLLNLPKIHKVNLGGLQISVDLKVDNPGKERITVKIPSVRLYYKGKLLATTAISDKTYTIEPVTSGKISGIMIQSTYLNLLSTAPGIISDFAQQGSKLTANFGFDVLAEVNGVPLKIQKL